MTTKDRVHKIPRAPQPHLSERQLIPRIRRGDLWRLGRHRLFCGDATNSEHVGRCLGSIVPAMCVTDPPYGVEYEPGWRNGVLNTRDSKRCRAIANDNQADWRKALALFPGNILYVFHAAIRAGQAFAQVEAIGFQPRSVLIWDKQRLVMSRGHYHWRHEPILYAVRKGCTAKWTGDRKQMTVRPCKTIRSCRDQRDVTSHPCQKPVELLAGFIANHGQPGDSVYEPFAGSGSTLFACEATGRRCLAIELDQRYCREILLRWLRHGGSRPTLIGRL